MSNQERDGAGEAESPLEIARQVLERKIAGATNEEIADTLALDPGDVSRILADAARVAGATPDLIRQRELIDLEWIEANCRDAYKKSTKGKKGKTKPGEIKYLRTILLSKQRRGAMIGTDAPKVRVQIVEEHRRQVIAFIVPDTIAVLQAMGLSLDQIEQFATLFDQRQRARLATPIQPEREA